MHFPPKFHLRKNGRYLFYFSTLNPSPSFSLQTQNPNFISLLNITNSNHNSPIYERIPNSFFRHSLVVSSIPSLVHSSVPMIRAKHSTVNSVSFIIRNNSSSFIFNRIPFAMHTSLQFLETAVCAGNLYPNSCVVNSSPFSCYLRSQLFSNSSWSEKPGAGFQIRRENKRNSSLRRINVDEFEEVVELIERGGDDMGRKLNQMNPTLSIDSVSKILSVLNDRRISAVSYFIWLRKTHSNLNQSPVIYNQIINNFGYLEDYDSMLSMLKELSLKHCCLTEKTFEFLMVLSQDPIQIGRSVERVVETLCRAKGSCCSSGIYALIKMLCALNSFNLATYVIEETVRRASYYHILIAAKCRNGDFQEARELFNEMRRFGFDPNTKSYNYLLGGLCKKGKIAEACELLEMMESLGYLPDPITFEIISFHACRLGRIDFAIEFLYQMMSIGLKPRSTTHAAFIKGYFWSNRIRCAHKYVVEMSDKDKHSSNLNYSLLASLFQKSGRAVEASEILVEMMKKGLKPNFPVYMRVLKDLCKMRKEDIVADLKFRFSKFHPIQEDGLHCA